MRHVLSGVLAGVASLAVTALPASAETASIYGMTASILTKNPGAFLPANTQLACFSMDGSKCWDGKTWHQLYPLGPRHYTVAVTDRVACSVIVAPKNDCWTGRAWYRLPKGQVFGAIGGIFSDTPGAFITAPVPPHPVTYVSAQLSMGGVASNR